MADMPLDHPIIVPKELVNDDAYLVAAVLAKEGDKVAREQPLVEMETSKSAFTIASPADGFFYPHYAAGQMVAAGEVFGVVADALRQNDALLAGQTAGAAKPDPRFSLAAWERFLQSGLPLSLFDNLAHVKKQDVEAAVARQEQQTLGPDALHPIARLAALSPDAKEQAVVLLGGGGHARECIDVIERSGVLRIAGILDTRNAPGTMIAGHPVLGGNDQLKMLQDAGLRNLVLAYGIGGGQADRGRHFRELLDMGFLFPNIIHPQAAVNRHAVLGRGVQVMAGVVLGSQAEVGDACILNSNAVVSHDCILESNVHIAPGAVLAGGVCVGRDTVIGMGSTVYMRVRVGAENVIANGTHVFSDVPDHAAAM